MTTTTLIMAIFQDKLSKPVPEWQTILDFCNEARDYGEIWQLLDYTQIRLDALANAKSAVSKL